MTARIEAIRRRTGSALRARPRDYEVGCIMISQPAFFARDDWIADWHPRIQGGKTIDVARDDGQRILGDCLQRTARLRRQAEPLVDELRRYGAPHTVQPRLGQGTFRIAVTGAYGACAVSGEHSLPALEAAHVRPYAQGGEHALPTGCCSAPTSTVSTTPATSPSRPTTAPASATTSLTTSAGGREYERFAGRAITVPRAPLDQPDPELLD
jgi:putative restriction endonuclease